MHKGGEREKNKKVVLPNGQPLSSPPPSRPPPSASVAAAIAAAVPHASTGAIVEAVARVNAGRHTRSHPRACCERIIATPGIGIFIPPPRQPPPGRRCCCRRQRYPKNSTGAIAVAVTQVDSVVVAIIRGLPARARRERIVATPGVGMFTPPTRQPPPICIQPCQPIQSFATPRI